MWGKKTQLAYSSNVAIWFVGRICTKAAPPYAMASNALGDLADLECVEDLISLQISVYHNQIKREGNVDFHA